MKQLNGQLTKNRFQGDSQDVFMSDFAFLSCGTLSMDQARQFGFYAFVDTLESIFEKPGILPPIKINAARPSGFLQHVLMCSEDVIVAPLRLEVFSSKSLHLTLGPK